MRLCSRKKAAVSKAMTLIQGSAALVSSMYAGISAVDIAELRKHCSSCGVTLRVMRNKLLITALAATINRTVLASLPCTLRGQLLYAFGPSIESIAGSLSSANIKCLAPVHGMELPGRIFLQCEMAVMMNLPPIDELWARVTHLVASPITQLINTLRAIASRAEAQRCRTMT
ncbi:putative 50S ribosomal protein L10 [Candidatus Tremblaya princeps PCIT]|uniref:Large ribosomal subunit protein uL10 n=1 Tax=Tremblaya princeps (strain PCIT) TaxID=891398 RepID=F7XYL7_TREPP|nr:putative 50S ribosomal protein L10 [Candidatus Tremblaya princeps PCIT]AEK38472.1 50S ribosomal protein L10 [Candidatus Tremblaya princeps PCVAL]